MELNFKKFNIKSGRFCFILTRNGDKHKKKWNYSTLENALCAIPDKSLLKNELQTKREILAELEEIKEYIKSLTTEKLKNK